MRSISSFPVKGGYAVRYAADANRPWFCVSDLITATGSRTIKGLVRELPNQMKRIIPTITKSGTQPLAFIDYEGAFAVLNRPLALLDSQKRCMDLLDLIEDAGDWTAIEGHPIHRAS